MIQWEELETANAALNAFVDFDQGAQFGEGPFDAITIGVKANIAAKGLPWTGGIGAYRDRIATEDADAVARLKSAGAAIIGMLNMEEAALGAKTDNPFFGATQNPHQIGYTPGGSSGGSAAAVAAGLCDMALGTDTMGSVRIPASYCGIYGLKPTHGAISQDGLEIAEASLDSIGPMARSLEALEACSRILMDFKNPQAIDNIALLENLGDVTCEAGVLESYQTACYNMNAEGSFSLPYPQTRIRYAGFILTSLALSESLGELLESNPEGLSEGLRFLLKFGPERSASDLAEDRDILAKTSAAMNAVVAQHGAILLPTAPQAAFSHEDKAPANQADFTCLASIAGLPAITVPAGQDDQGMPLGVQLIGAAGNEAGLFHLAKTLDNRMAAYRRPTIFYGK
ncbi:MAG: amidase [Parasphingorhabdus sp.]|uniref:amidase n=3 Tax=Parasphingorhabdus sp. TaxID=2709688 RepID=UPI003266845D